MSALIKRLDNEATLRARKIINNHFINNNDLDNLINFKQNVERQINLSESQLNISVSSKLDALKRAYDIIDESSIKLNKLLINLNKINEKINSTNTSINKYVYIKYIHNAKENINKVINLVELFTQIPEKINNLNNLLNDDVTFLKDVYLETIQLASLREGLLKEIDNDLYNNNNSLKQFIINYLLNIPKLLENIKNKLLNNISLYILIDTTTSYELILTFEIIEMHVEYMNRRYKNNSSINEDFFTIVNRKISDIFIDKINSSYIMCKESPEYEKQPFSSILNTSTSLLHFLNDTLSEISVCMPPKYNIISTYIDYLHEFTYSEINLLITEYTLNKVNLNNILDILNWIEYYKTQISIYQPQIDVSTNKSSADINSNTSSSSSSSSLSKLLLLFDDLLNEYLYRIKIQMQEWFNNITSQELNIVKTTTGLLITTNPEDMFNILYIQINIAIEKLPSSYLYNVISTLLSILREIQRQTYDNLSNHWRNYEIDVLCSIINDNQRMQEKTDEFSSYVLSLHGIDNNDSKVIVENMLEELSSEYIALAVTAVNFLARCTLTDLEEPVFSKLFTAEWENGEPLISVLTATLDDYFKDIFLWCNEYFNTKYVKEIFYLVINLYVMSIRKIANGAFRFINEITIANRLIKDRDMLEEYFNKYMDILKRGGLKLEKDSKSKDMSPITYELQIFKSLAIIITTTNINSINPIEKDIKLILSRYALDGLKLLIAIYLSNPIYKKTDKQIFIDKLIKFYETNYDKGFVLLDKYKTYDIVDTIVIKSYFETVQNVATSGSIINTNSVNATNKTTKTMFWSKAKPVVDKTY